MIYGQKRASKEAIATKDMTLEQAMLWSQSGIDYQSRRIEINHEVGDAMASFIVRALIKMAEISRDPIEIYLSSGGGEVYSGLAIYDAIQACPCDVSIYGSGKIMSSAFVIFLAGDKRIASKHATFMMHSISFYGGDEGTKLKDKEIDVMEAKRLNNVFLDILGQRTKMNKKWWYRQILSHDKFFDLNQAKEYGIVTPTVTTKKEAVNVRKPKSKKRKVRNKIKRK